MKYIKLNTNWNADPNAPEPSVTVLGGKVELHFYLNYFVYERFKEGDRGTLKFNNVHKYRLGPTNDEGYYMGQFRYTYSELPWGEFYELPDSNWRTDFPTDNSELIELSQLKNPRHFIFFLRDETFECIAEEFEYSELANN